MRVLIDNCVPWRLGDAIVGHNVSSVVKLGLAGLDDGPLLDAMVGHFDVLVTVDKSIPFQQQLAGRAVAVIVLRARSNNLKELLPLIPALHEALEGIAPGEAREIG